MSEQRTAVFNAKFGDKRGSGWQDAFKDIVPQIELLGLIVSRNFLIQVE